MSQRKPKAIISSAEEPLSLHLSLVFLEYVFFKELLLRSSLQDIIITRLLPSRIYSIVKTKSTHRKYVIKKETPRFLA